MWENINGNGEVARNGMGVKPNTPNSQLNVKIYFNYVIYTMAGSPWTSKFGCPGAESKTC